MDNDLNKENIEQDKKSQEGIALVLSMLFLAVIAIFVTAFLFMAQHETQLSTIGDKTEKAFYSANAGIHEATFKLSQNENYGTTNPSGNYSTVLSDVSFGSGTYTVKVKNTISSNKFIVIDSQGTYLTRSRRIELTLKKTTVEDPDVHFEHAVFSDGDLTINGGITVNGDFTLKRTLTHGRDDPDPDGNPGTNSEPGVDCPDGVGNPFTVAATGNITLSSAESTDGILFTEKNFTLNGNSGIGNGALFAKGAVLNGGGAAYNVTFDTTLLEIVIPGVGSEQLITYSWKELVAY